MTTSPTSAVSRRKLGFTLVEMMVTIAVIAVLAGILLPAIAKTRLHARRTRIAADLQTISVGLNEYRNTFGVFPSVDGTDPIEPAPGDDLAPKPAPNLGASVLGKALIGPYGDRFTVSASNQISVDSQDPPAYDSNKQYKPGECVQTGNAANQVYVAVGFHVTSQPPDPNYALWVPFDGADGADGPGFRTRRSAPNAAANNYRLPQGRIYGPFLNPESFKVVGCDIYDIGGHPILYFPVLPGKTNIRVITTTAAGPKVGGFVRSIDSSYAAFQPRSLINASDNLVPFRRAGESDDVNSLRRLQIMLGDTNCNGLIDTDETPAKLSDYLLYSSGLDASSDDPGIYGPINFTPLNTNTPTDNQTNRAAVEACDDVTNAQ